MDMLYVDQDATRNARWIATVTVASIVKAISQVLIPQIQEPCV